MTILSRLRSATGPSRELDARIWAEFDGRDVVGPVSSATWSDAYFGKSRKEPHDECFLWQSGGAADHIPRYTISIDAALTLVPPTLRWQVERDGLGFIGLVWNHKTLESWMGESKATPAIAVLIAIIRYHGGEFEGF
jgi:hypothetical protein